MPIFLGVRITTKETRTNGDVISGEIGLTVTRSISVTEIEVKLEGVSHSQFSITKQRNNKTEYKTIRDTHKFLYETMVVFPPANVRQVSQAKDFTLTPGLYAYPFEFRLPMNTRCSGKQSGDLGHTTFQLPPSMDIAGFVSTRYFVKATCKRSSFFKVNLREADPFHFTPLDPIVPSSERKVFVRKRIVFKNRVPETIGITLPPEALAKKNLPTTPQKAKRGFFKLLFDKSEGLPSPPQRLGSKTYHLGLESQDVPFGFEIRFTDPPCMIPGQPVLFSLFLVTDTDPSVFSFANFGKPEDSNGMGVVYLQGLDANIISKTTATAIEFGNNQVHSDFRELSVELFKNSFENYRFDLKDCVPLENNMTGMTDFRYELKIPSKYYSNCVLPEDIIPSFSVCNVRRSYAFTMNAAFSSGRIENLGSKRQNWNLLYAADLFCPDIRVLSGRTHNGPISQKTEPIPYNGTSNEPRRNSYNCNFPEEKRPINEVPPNEQGPTIPDEFHADDGSALPTYDDATRN